MTPEKLCKYYLDSKCALEGGYCDLNCNRPSDREDSEFDDRMDVADQWKNERESAVWSSIAILPKLESMK